MSDAVHPPAVDRQQLCRDPAWRAVVVGKLANARRFQRGSPGYGQLQSGSPPGTDGVVNLSNFSCGGHGPFR